MKKYSLISILIIFTFPSLQFIQGQGKSTSQKAWVWVTNLNTREKPDRTSNKLGSLDIGDIVTIKEVSKKKDKVGEVSDYWKLISDYSGTESWVFGGFIWEIKKSNLNKIYNKIIEKELYGIRELKPDYSISKNDISGKSFRFSEITFKCASSGYSTSYSYNFLDNKNFKMKKSSDPNNSIEGKGTYQIKGDSIILSYSSASENSPKDETLVYFPDIQMAILDTFKKPVYSIKSESILGYADDLIIWDFCMKKEYQFTNYELFKNDHFTFINYEN